MNDLNALLRAIIENPDADDPRLMYADALEELPTVSVTCTACWGTGSHSINPYELAQRYGTHRAGVILDAAKCNVCSGHGIVDSFPNRLRAELIRIQIQHARDPDPELDKRANGILKSSHRYNWSAAIASPSSANWLGAVSLRWNRGFISQIEIPCGYFVKNADNLIWNPGRTVICPELNCDDGYIQRTANSGPGGQWFGKPCRTCDATGRIPAPCPDLAHPVRTVVLTAGDVDRFFVAYNFKPFTVGADTVWRCVGWPGIDFRNLN